MRSSTFRCLGLSLVSFFVALPISAEPDTEAAAVRSEQILGRSDLSAYHGWIKYLQFRAATAAERFGADHEQVAVDRTKLAEWTERILDNPNVLSELRGRQEWAYESPVDGSGQPFLMNIPTDYDPAKPARVVVSMHGSGGNHLEHATGLQDHPGHFEVSVLGRARNGFYIGLSEADVLHVLDYLEEHWAIDPDRVHLTGGSMGGHGTFWLGSRYPHRFASGRPVCGFASGKPIANLLTLPIYATHSDDDPQVSVLQSRAPLARLREMGGKVIYDETTGLGHAAWEYQDGNRRGFEWETHQVRPASTEVRRIDFTALDGQAARAWWAEVAEWGPAPKPARFVLSVGADNVLHAETTNVARLGIRIAESPFRRDRAIKVSLNGQVPMEFAAPLPDTVFVSEGKLSVDEVKAPYRLHTPGGQLSLYNGDPLLVVYGTHGDEATQTALKNAGLAAARGPNYIWQAGDDGGSTGQPRAVDGIPNGNNLYGDLRTKADVDVTEKDIAQHHLILIGTAAQNSLVARIEPQLPVRMTEREIVCGDGFSVAAEERMLNLVHFNPLAPDRLISWTASHDLKGYVASQPTSGLGFYGFVGADLIVSRSDKPILVTTRSFDSHWQWTTRAGDDRLTGRELDHEVAASAAIGDAIRREAAGDYSIVTRGAGFGGTLFTPGVTRIGDIASLSYYDPIGILEVSGEKLRSILTDLEKIAAPEFGFQLQPMPRAIDARRTYRIAIQTSRLFPIGRATLYNGPYRQTDLMVDSAIERYLGKE